MQFTPFQARLAVTCVKKSGAEVLPNNWPIERIEPAHFTQ
jgi:hypothetical protein